MIPRLLAFLIYCRHNLNTSLWRSGSQIWCSKCARAGGTWRLSRSILDSACLYVSRLTIEVVDAHFLGLMSNILPIRSVWFSATFYLIGGGQAVVMSMMYTIASQYTTEDER